MGGSTEKAKGIESRARQTDNMSTNNAVASADQEMNAGLNAIDDLEEADKIRMEEINQVFEGKNISSGRVDELMAMDEPKFKDIMLKNKKVNEWLVDGYIDEQFAYDFREGKYDHNEPFFEELMENKGLWDKAKSAETHLTLDEIEDERDRLIGLADAGEARNSIRENVRRIRENRRKFRS